MSYNNISFPLESSWLKLLESEFTKPYYLNLIKFLKNERERNCVFPESELVFAALNAIPVHNVKVVIIGQDPYHGYGQANGLSFSVKSGLPIPPSLKNIYKELCDDLGIHRPTQGDLTPWAQQGVLLLNASLTVREKMPGSHQKIGWEIFTDQLISNLSDSSDGIVFLLWGKFAERKVRHINQKKHHFLVAPHPSPFSAHKGFLGCRHFSQTNQLLEAMNKKPINWALP